MSGKRTTPSGSSSPTVGYGTPPVETRFKKGQSGNPKGRPLGSKNRPKSDIDHVKQLILGESRRIIKITDSRGEHYISAIDAAIRSLSNAALRGNISALKYLIGTTIDIDNEQRNTRNETIQKIIEYKYSWSKF